MDNQNDPLNDIHYNDKIALGIELSESDKEKMRFMNVRDGLGEISNKKQLEYISYEAKRLAMKASMEEAEQKRQEAIEQGLPPKPKPEYVDLNTSVTAHKHLIHHNTSKEEAMEYAAKMSDKPDGWVDAAKHSNFKHARSTVKVMKEDAVHKDMVKTRKLKDKWLKKTDTWYQYMEVLEHAKENHDTFLMTLALKKLAEEQQKEIDMLKVENLEREKESKELQGCMQEVNEILGNTQSKKSKGLSLRELGYTQKEVGKMLDVSLRTVKRWDSSK